MARIKPAKEKADASAASAGSTAGQSTRNRAKLLVISVLSLVVVLYSARSIWLRVRDRIATSNEYRLAPENVVITPPPTWIKSDVKAEILRDGSLDGNVSLLDKQLTERIHTATLLHPWVENATVRVSYPASVEVEITYRRPVAMVEVPGGLLPIDRSGVVLPTADFTAEDVKPFPRVIGIATGASGGVGVEWGDPQVQEIALIADELSEAWPTLNLASIQPTFSTGLDKNHQYELTSKSGWTAVWGRAPGKEIESEPKAQAKVAALKAFVQQNSGIRSAIAGAAIDLRKVQ